MIFGKMTKQYYNELNLRDKAIKKAIADASINDLVLIAGKGHENYQIFDNQKSYFDDREFAKKALISKISN